MAKPILAANHIAGRKRLQWQADGIKSCPRCKQIKPISDYHRRGEYGIASYCKACEGIRAKEKKPIKRPSRFESEALRECRGCSKIKPKEGGFYRAIKGSGVGGYTIYCRSCQLARTKASREKSNGAHWRTYQEKVRRDPRLRLKSRALGLVRKSLEGRFRYKKTGSVTSGFWDSVGYTPDQLFAHIERQFTKGMSWSNMREWHIDHIIPDSSFDYHSMDCEGFKQSWALTNLRPLWARENTSKGASLVFLI